MTTHSLPREVNRRAVALLVLMLVFLLAWQDDGDTTDEDREAAPVTYVLGRATSV